MNFISWSNEYKKKIKDMNPGDVFIYEDFLWMVSSGNNGVNIYAIRLMDGKLDSFDKDDECEMCMGKMTIVLSGLN